MVCHRDVLCVGSGGVSDLLACLGPLSVFLACFGVCAWFCCVTAPGGGL